MLVHLRDAAPHAFDEASVSEIERDKLSAFSLQRFPQKHASGYRERKVVLRRELAEGGVYVRLHIHPDEFQILARHAALVRLAPSGCKRMVVLT